MELEKTISIRKFWHCADFVAAYFGHRQVSLTNQLLIYQFALHYAKLLT